MRFAAIPAFAVLLMVPAHLQRIPISKRWIRSSPITIKLVLPAAHWA